MCARYFYCVTSTLLCQTPTCLDGVTTIVTDGFIVQPTHSIHYKEPLPTRGAQQVHIRRREILRISRNTKKTEYLKIYITFDACQDSRQTLPDITDP